MIYNCIIVGTIPDGLSSSHWSPDQELLVLLTNSNVMILMTKEFDILVEQPISLENQVEAAFVNVGYGSYETQFKGSESEKAVKEKGEEKLLDWDDRKGRICWRIDGEYYVISLIDTLTYSRKFHGGFTLPFQLNEMKVSGIYWNLDSTILCVLSEKIHENLRVGRIKFKY
jgi:hypothetical protein